VRSYLVNNLYYNTICSVHAEIFRIFKKIEELNTNEEILQEVKLGIKFVNVATEMGRSMEYAITKDKSFNPMNNFLEQQGLLIFDEEDRE